MRHAIVGAGFGAGVHLPAFTCLADVEVVAVADNGSGRASGFDKSTVAIYSDWRRMLDEVRPDSISVAVPPHAQRSIVENALHRRIHVLCEKPLGMDCDDALAMRDLARSASVVAAVGLQFRFEPGMSALRTQIRSARLGQIHRIDFTWITAGRADSRRPWSWQHDAPLGGGVVNAFMPHVVDLLTWLSDCQLMSVAARTSVLIPRRQDSSGTWHEVTAEDMVDALCELDNGGIASVRVTNCQHGGEGMRIEVHGERGVLRYVHRPPFAGDVHLTCWPPAGQAETLVVDESAGGAADSRALPFRTLAQLFIGATRGVPAPQMPTFDDACRAQRVLAALRLSAVQHQAIPV